MVTIKLNLPEVVGNLSAKLGKITDKEFLLRPVALDLIPIMKRRIHIDGQDSSGNQIGTYSPGYLAVRSGIFKSNQKFTRGVNKGKTKNTGVFTKGKNKGQPRPNYNRGTDPKVIISLTRQLENDYTVIATEKGYGIGFSNSHNFDKSQWVQETYNKRIFDLTDSELQFAQDRLQKLIDQAFEK